jgi:hypothetical protein
MLDRRRFSLAALAALLGFAAWAVAPAAAEPRPAAPPKAGGFTCPLTGEDLPCPQCCPLNQQTAGADCCADPDCPPGCCPECPPDCVDLKTGAGGKIGRTAKGGFCPPCPFCP